MPALQELVVLDRFVSFDRHLKLQRIVKAGQKDKKKNGKCIVKLLRLLLAYVHQGILKHRQWFLFLHCCDEFC